MSTVERPYWPEATHEEAKLLLDAGFVADFNEHGRAIWHNNLPMSLVPAQMPSPGNGRIQLYKTRGLLGGSRWECSGDFGWQTASPRSSNCLSKLLGDIEDLLEGNAAKPRTLDPSERVATAESLTEDDLAVLELVAIRRQVTIKEIRGHFERIGRPAREGARSACALRRGGLLNSGTFANGEYIGTDISGQSRYAPGQPYWVLTKAGRQALEAGQ
jgi:hypothetical protein